MFKRIQRQKRIRVVPSFVAWSIGKDACLGTEKDFMDSIGNGVLFEALWPSQRVF
jgi:hypothetical protein